MSRVAGQTGLVANQALSLPPPETEIDRRSRAAALADATRALSRIRQQSPGSVGLQGARTEQLLSAPAAPAPVSAATSASPLSDPAILDRIGRQILTRQAQPTLAERFVAAGGRATRPGEAFSILEASAQEERLRRNNQLQNLLNLARLQQQIKNAAIRSQELERSRQMDLLSLAREQRLRDRVAQQAQEGLIETSLDAISGLVPPKEFDAFVSKVNQGTSPRVAAFETIGGEAPIGTVIALERLGMMGVTDRSVFDTARVKLATPKTTAREQRKTEEEQQFNRFVELLQTGDRNAIREHFAEATSLQAQMLNAAERVNPQLAKELTFLGRRIAGFDTAEAEEILDRPNILNR